jgi:hypothetical protein
VSGRHGIRAAGVRGRGGGPASYRASQREDRSSRVGRASTEGASAPTCGSPGIPGELSPPTQPGT